MKLKTLLFGKTYAFRDVKDVLAKSLGSNNAVNNAWATMKALGELRTAAQVSRTRGVGLERMSLRPEVREAAESEVNDGQKPADGRDDADCKMGRSY